MEGLTIAASEASSERLGSEDTVSWLCSPALFRSRKIDDLPRPLALDVKASCDAGARVCSDKQRVGREICRHGLIYPQMFHA